MSDDIDRVETLPAEEVCVEPPTKMRALPAETNKYRAHPIRLYCEHKAPGSKNRRSTTCRDLFEVVPDASDGVDKVYLIYGGDKKLTGPENLKRVRDDAGDQAYELPCEFPDDLKEDSFTKLAFWDALGKSQSYALKGLEKDIEIKVYPPHQYKFELSFPPLRKVSGGSKITTHKKGVEEEYKKVQEVKTTVEKQSWEPWNGNVQHTQKVTETTTRTESPLDNSAQIEYKLDGEKKKSVGAPGPIKYSVDGVAVQLDVLKIIGAILELGSKILEMYRKVRDSVPKVGWYFEADFQLMQGAVVLAWGWKEHRDHRAYLWMGASLNINILAVSVEIGVGVEGFSFALQLFGKIDGTLSVSMKSQRSSPDMDKSFGVPLEAQIKGTLGLRFKVSYAAKAEGTVETALKISGQMKIDTEEGPSMKTNMTWTGIAAVVTASVGPAGVFGQKKKSVTLIEKTNIGAWKWPDGEPYEPVRIPQSEIESIMKDTFTKGLNVRVRKPVTKHVPVVDWVVDTEHEGTEVMHIEDVVNRIATQFDKKRILRDRKTIEALAHDIRQALDQRANVTDEWGPNSLSLDSFEEFCDGELLLILEDYIDPMEECKGKIA